jgi:hypothetical protein
MGVMFGQSSGLGSCENSIYIFTKKTNTGNYKFTIAKSKLTTFLPRYRLSYSAVDFDILRTKEKQATAESRKLYLLLNGSALRYFGPGVYISNNTIIDCNNDNIAFKLGVGDEYACRLYGICNSAKFLGRVGEIVYYLKSNSNIIIDGINASTGKQIKPLNVSNNVVRIHGVSAHPLFSTKILVFADTLCENGDPGKTIDKTIEVDLGNRASQP